MNDEQEEINKLIKEAGFNAEVPVFTDNYSAVMSFDVARTLPQDPAEDQQQTTEETE